MIDLELTSREAEVLADHLEEAISALRAEIADTDGWRFRDQLKDEKVHLVDVLKKLRDAMGVERASG